LVLRLLGSGIASEKFSDRHARHSAKRRGVCCCCSVVTACGRRDGCDLWKCESGSGASLCVPRSAKSDRMCLCASMGVRDRGEYGQRRLLC
jgi:hypothetical protein